MHTGGKFHRTPVFLRVALQPGDRINGPAIIAEANATNWTESMICKTKDLFYEAKLNECIKKGDEVAIKIHYGEYNRTAILRPEYIAASVESEQHDAVCQWGEVCRG